jgi:hypothetical protein
MDQTGPAEGLAQVGSYLEHKHIRGNMVPVNSGFHNENNFFKNYLKKVSPALY